MGQPHQTRQPAGPAGSSVGQPHQTRQPAGPAGSPVGQPAGQRQLAACFEYVGRTALTVVGPATGIRYHFDRPGARLMVDLRDRRSLATVPHLRQV